MITAFSSPEAFDMKICFDGADLLKSRIGKALCNRYLAKEIRKVRKGLPDLELFVADAVKRRQKKEPDHLLPVKLRDEYEVGIFTTGETYGYNHAVFNKEWLELWGPRSLGVEFLVVPSRDRNGVINDVGLRVLSTASVLEAFKWIFLCGQQSTFGLHKATSKELVVVEGAWDQIAFEQSNIPNVVGLGSVTVTKGHAKQLEGYTYKECWDQDRHGLARRDINNCCFYSPAGKDPFDAWLTNGQLKLIRT